MTEARFSMWNEAGSSAYEMGKGIVYLRHLFVK